MMVMMMMMMMMIMMMMPVMMTMVMMIHKAIKEGYDGGMVSYKTKNAMELIRRMKVANTMVMMMAMMTMMMKMKMMCTIMEIRS